MSEYKVMKGERFPSALNLTNIDEYPIGEDEPSYAHPVAKFLDEVSRSEKKHDPLLIIHLDPSAKV